MTRRVLIMGAAGRDFHDFNVTYRDDPQSEVVAFTATQIPFIADRTYPPEPAGPRYPEGIPIFPEERLADLIADLKVDALPQFLTPYLSTRLIPVVLDVRQGVEDDGGGSQGARRFEGRARPGT